MMLQAIITRRRSVQVFFVVTCWAAASRASCPSDWYSFGNACYGAFEGPATWDEAKAACEAKGARLTSIHSQAENDHAIFTCGNQRPFAQACWIGGTDRNQRHRRWIWVDGSDWDYNRWFDHGGGNAEPNNDFCSTPRYCTYGHTSDCNVLEVSKKLPYGGYWLDTFCTDRLKYICKVDAGKEVRLSNGRALVRLVSDKPDVRSSQRRVREAEEPEALKLYCQRQKSDPTTEAQYFIRAAGFGRNASQAEELRMNPEWMELTSKSNRAIESAASSLRSPSNLQTSRFIRSAVSVKKVAVHASLSMRSQPSDVTPVSYEPTIRSSEEEDDSFGRYQLPPPIAPHSKFRMSWDISGFLLLMSDVFTLPIILSWDVEADTVTASGTMLIAVSWLSVCFWAADIVANFNTGFYDHGTLDLNRPRIVDNYLRGWFAFDLFIVIMDIVLVTLPPIDKGANSAMRSVKVLRALRAVRLLRLMKMSRFNAAIEEVAVATGRQWLLMVISMLKTLLGILVVAHSLACLWCFIGRAVSAKGGVSWLEKEGALHVAGTLQYLHAVQWLLNPPSPAPIEPTNTEERLGNLFIIIFALIVMGSALGKFTSALQELNAINAEKSRKRREVRSYLQAQASSVELTARIMRFVDHRLSLQDASVAIDLSLISPTLQMELYVNQRSHFLENHPLFLLTKELYPVNFANICAAMVKQVFEKGETIFQAGQFASTMLITALGEYTLTDDEFVDNQLKFAEVDTSITKFSGVRWFAEACIFAEGIIHKLTLRAETFCDAFTLTSRDLQASLQDSPACTYMFCEYAKDFLAGLKQHRDPFNYEVAAAVCEKAVKQNQHFMELHPDANALIEHFGRMSARTSTSNFLSNYSSDSGELDSPSFLSSSSRWQIAKLESAEHFVELALNGNIIDQDDLSVGLQNTFAELNPVTGSHTIFSQLGERDRSASSCLSILNLVADRYENFIGPQESHVSLTERQWQELRGIIEWIAPTQKQVHAVLVLLAIRSLGKSKRLVQQLPRKSQRPEAAVIFLIQHATNVVPSVAELDEETQHLLVQTLLVHENFNFAQMLQGENCPANVLQLQEMIKDNSALFKFYMLFFLGFMSGLGGGLGSRFMNTKIAESIIMGCSAIEFLLSATPQAIFWSYMTERARALAIPTRTPADLAVVRLACLSRVQDYSSYVKLRAVWMGISVRSREMLLKHFLADGITERAFVLEYFPLCIGNAVNNPFVRLPALLEVIVDFLDNLAPSIHSMPQIQEGTMMIPVDLSDLAEFISVVKNRFVFQTCIMRSKIRLVGNRICLEMSTANWTRTGDPDSDMTTLAHDVKEIIERLEVLEAHEEPTDNKDVPASKPAATGFTNLPRKQRMHI